MRAHQSQHQGAARRSRPFEEQCAAAEDAAFIARVNAIVLPPLEADDKFALRRML